MDGVDDARSIPAVDGVCGECGFDYDGLGDAEVSDVVRGLGRRYRAPLTRGLPGEALDELLRAHPVEGTWSVLEYACHVRDVLAAQRHRVERTLREDVPVCEPMGSEELVVRERYNEQDPVAVVQAVAANAEAFALAIDSVTGEQWTRRCIYPYPQPTERDVRWLSRQTVHEGRHHLLDVGRVLRAARGR